ncbi:uncharacterized protein EDB93DRAFT_1254384 [Suillus bovinus]|uniref:uncharacterized protein n=1 Tax=Suillus bovinus TaxID=48563 RepID=UPI001B88302E|nr:uncharacterized protein EDB93DRAFT_1254384 [Suillus bovinus]KAG2134880.1 hypothetical protein EDB93DRAFT_1254384 [Suillus bovinus]
MPSKKRKISDLTIEDTSRLFLALNTFQDNLDETELLPSLKKLAEKLQTRRTQHIYFPDQVIFNQLGIRSKPLVLRVDKRREIDSLGLAQTEVPTLDSQLCLQSGELNEAASRILMNMFLLRLASVIRNEETEVNIIPDFPISKTTFQGHSFDSVVDFLAIPAHSEYTDLLLDTPVAALTSHNFT